MICRPAQQEDIPVIAAMLRKSKPDVEDDAVKEIFDDPTHAIFVLADGDVLAGIIIVLAAGRNAMALYWHVDEEYRMHFSPSQYAEHFTKWAAERGVRIVNSMALGDDGAGRFQALLDEQRRQGRKVALTESES